MDSNEKKGKRPRIGSRPYPVDSHDNGRENTSGEFTSGSENNSEGIHNRRNACEIEIRCSIDYGYFRHNPAQ